MTKTKNDWADKASCKNHDPLIFYPDPMTKASTKEAISICKSCPVRAECLQYSVTHYESYGIWGGLSYRSRMKFKSNLDGDYSVKRIKKAIINNEV